MNYSVNAVFALIEEQLRTGLTPRYEPDLPGEAEATLADISGGRVLGWEPKVDIREGLRRSIAYLRDRVAPYKVPKHVAMMPSLPRNAVGKVVKPDLVKLLATHFQPAR